MELASRYVILTEDGQPSTSFSQTHDCETWIAEELGVPYRDLDEYTAPWRVRGIRTHGAWERDGKFRQVVHGEDYKRKHPEYFA